MLYDMNRTINGEYFEGKFTRADFQGGVSKTTMVITSYKGIAERLTELIELIVTLEGEWKVIINQLQH